MRSIFGREPALFINVIAAALGMFVSLDFAGLNDGKAAAIVAVLTAGAAIFQAWHTRPVAVSLFTGFVGTAAVLAASFGLDFTQQQVGAVQLVVVTVLTLLARGQITPVADPRPLYPLPPMRMS
jgi:hypothetical protein